ncbi:DedA family protein [Roseivivax sediminis]|uniref:Membrane protein DedA, SNARE-associated domain n=1 Tax=Roseivivax sediminis TaxID=936889 RepID=A0A1I1YVG1_9RHOB|nr:DedA family protein [Roseivivax sediminis]SFE22968.1 membrane protein DedA, SNARE-associated domain [Roseivivax sediminis]
MTGWITSLMEQSSYAAAAFLMFLENVFPPIPSEIVLPLAGFIAHRDGLSLVLMIATGSAGSLAGAVLWYYLGAWIGLDRLKSFARKYGRWLTLTPGEIDAADAWFDNHGGKAVFIGRLVPGIRTFISVPAGLSGMGMGKFLSYTAAGTVIWTTFLTVAGWFLGRNYAAVSGWLAPVSNVVLVVLVGWYLYRVATFRRTIRREDEKRDRA